MPVSELDILKKLLSEEEAETLRLSFEEDPMGFILNKYPGLNNVLEYMLTKDFREYLSAIFIVAPKPTTFKVVLHNGQHFFLQFMGKTYQATVLGKNYYLMTIGEKERCMIAIARLLRYGVPLKTKGPEEGEAGAGALGGDTTSPPAETSEPAADTGGGEAGGEALEEGSILLEILKKKFDLTEAAKKKVAVKKKGASKSPEEVIDTAELEKQIGDFVQANKIAAPYYDKIQRKSQKGSMFTLYLKDMPKGENSRGFRHSVASGLKNKMGWKHEDIGSKEDPKFAISNKFGERYTVQVKLTQSDGATDTNMKEGLTILYYYTDLKDPITDEITRKAHKEALLQSLASNGANIGGEKDTIDKIKNLINIKFGKEDSQKKAISALNQAFSQAQTIRSAYGGLTITRTGIYDEIRNTTEMVLGLDKDKWCPGDVYIIEEKKLKEGSSLDTILSTAKSEYDTNQKENQNVARKLYTDTINKLFNNAWGDREAPLTAISLKFEEAQAGKGKDYFSYTFQEKEENASWNVSNEDLKKFQDIEKQKISKEKKIEQKMAIIRQQQAILKKFLQGDKEIVYEGGDYSQMDKEDKYIPKFAALKLMNFLFSKASQGAAEIRALELLNHAASLTIYTPTWFKVQAYKSGAPAKHITFKIGEQYKLETKEGLVLPIKVIDTPSYGGLKLMYSLSKGSDQPPVSQRMQLSVRGHGKGAQVAPELEIPKST